MFMTVLESVVLIHCIAVNSCGSVKIVTVGDKIQTLLVLSPFSVIYCRHILGIASRTLSLTLPFLEFRDERNFKGLHVSVKKQTKNVRI